MITTCHCNVRHVNNQTLFLAMVVINNFFTAARARIVAKKSFVPYSTQVQKSTSKLQSFGEVDVETLYGNDQGIVVVGLNRPKARNALGKSLLKSILDASNFLNNENTRVAILRSYVPGVFCAGADLKERALMTNDEVKVFVKSLRQMMINIENLPMPTIAAIDGHALGGGTEMALACDLRVASDNARMGLIETSLGLIPGAGGTQRLPRIVGKALAKELIFTSAIFSGDKAKELGVVNYSVPQNETSDAAFHKALDVARVLIQNAPVALRQAKLAIDEGMQCPIDEGYEVEQKCYNVIVETKDRLEGLLAFKEKRKPVYKGQ